MVEKASRRWGKWDVLLEGPLDSRAGSPVQVLAELHTRQGLNCHALPNVTVDSTINSIGIKVNSLLRESPQAAPLYQAE